jgi:hypothetical protein
MSGRVLSSLSVRIRILSNGGGPPRSVSRRSRFIRDLLPRTYTRADDIGYVWGS